jgi:hypothetical protein
MNILHGLLREPSITHELSFLLPGLMIVVVQGFASPSWHFRNACTIIFGTMVQRMIGSKKVRDEHDMVNTVSSREFFYRFSPY